MKNEKNKVNKESLAAELIELSNNEMENIFIELIQSPRYYSALCKYANERALFIDRVQRTLDPQKDLVQMSRNQGACSGLNDHIGYMQLLLNKRNGILDEGKKDDVDKLY